MSDSPSKNPIPKPRRRRVRRKLGGLGALGLVLAASSAKAQLDLNPPLPNVLLLVDTSGSMESKLDGTPPVCVPTGTGSQRSRWIDLVEVLTGQIQDYRCQEINRSSSAFLSDYDANGPSGQAPYDYLYAVPYHRPMSGDCVAVPGQLPINAYDFPEDDPSTAPFEGAIRFRPYSSNVGSCTFNQAADGILDSFKDAARFGLMTFDPMTDPRTGVAGTTLDYNEGMLGGFTYFVGAAPRTANPNNCTDPPKPFEVGARNAAAPPWEGRLVGFGDPATGSSQFQTKRGQIERILLATRPFGGTPIAGILHDARDFLLNDDSVDPMNPSHTLGPSDDPYINDPASCRKQHIILLTDGEPNLDMRPFCEGSNGGLCPYEKPEQVAADLLSQSKPVRTYVVPFALPTFQLGGVERTCNDLTAADFVETVNTTPCGNPANANNIQLQVCCALNRIAVAGAPTPPPPAAGEPTVAPPRAFFSNDRQALQSALSRIMSALVNVTSRTQPVAAGPVRNGQGGFRFFSLVTPGSAQPWNSSLRRQRFTCDGTTLVNNTPSRAAGDLFDANIAAEKEKRVFVSVQPGIGAQPVNAVRTIRPQYQPVGSGDGAGTYSGTQYAGLPSAFITATSTDAMQLTATSCDGLTSASSCRDRYLNWLVGLPNGTNFSRCPDASNCALLGDILHSTPKVIGPPSDVLQDETYDDFTQAHLTRPVVLYTSTNDGFLHAFKVAPTDPNDALKVDKLENNELWAFVPPAVLPRLPSQFPFTHQTLLDGVPVIKDVVATDPTNVADIKLERSRNAAKAGTGTWRTILIQAFGPSRGGYFALDVTDPVLDPNNVNNADKGPRFLWQLTTDAGGTNPLFGTTGATPLITTLFFIPPGQSEALEVAVAVLPGGSGGPGTAGTGGGCPSGAGREMPDATQFDSFEPRIKVQCYSGAGIGGRSLTIVRLDTGEIIRTFRESLTDVSDVDLRARVSVAPIDSPITGQPAAFPADTGAVADRVYVGDQDGRLWRVNLASTNPAEWEMEIFFDAFPQSIPGVSNLHDFDDGQPITSPPVLSVDEIGDVTVNFATGEQETLGASGSMTNYVWSLTEKTATDRQISTAVTHVNWYKSFTNGERVVGPLVLFNSDLFFTTFRPPTSGGSPCDNGSSALWGMNYIVPKDFNPANPPPINQGGLPALPDPISKNPRVRQSWSSVEISSDGNAILFGVSVSQEPTCTQTTTDVPSDYFSTKATTHIRNVNPGKFQLVMHRGGVAGLDPTGGITNNVSTVTLASPPASARVDSWAALLE